MFKITVDFFRKIEEGNFIRASNFTFPTFPNTGHYFFFFSIQTIRAFTLRAKFSTITSSISPVFTRPRSSSNVSFPTAGLYETLSQGFLPSMKYFSIGSCDKRTRQKRGEKGKGQALQKLERFRVLSKHSIIVLF